MQYEKMTPKTIAHLIAVGWIDDAELDGLPLDLERVA